MYIHLIKIIISLKNYLKKSKYIFKKIKNYKILYIHISQFNFIFKKKKWCK